MQSLANTILFIINQFFTNTISIFINIVLIIIFSQNILNLIKNDKIHVYILDKKMKFFNKKILFKFKLNNNFSFKLLNKIKNEYFNKSKTFNNTQYLNIENKSIIFNIRYNF